MRSLTLTEVVERIRPADREAMGRARRRQGMLTKPEGALGVLEDLSIRLAGMWESERPAVTGKAVVVAVGDHGVTAQGVTGYPQEVTVQMAHNFLAGGAAVSVMANLQGVNQIVVDAGIAADALPPNPKLRSLRIGRGTADISGGPAMSRQQAVRCVEAGANLAMELAGQQEVNLIAVGEMGIGNTTVASAVTAAVTGRAPEETTGAGTGRTPEEIRHKTMVVRKALEVNAPDRNDPVEILAKVGGFEMGVMAGVMLGGAATRCAVLLDGFISGAAALIADGLNGTARHFMVASHRSAEPGHPVVLSHLGLEPLLDLNMRLGEGTGAVLAMPIVESAVACLAQMATFEQAGVSNRPESSP